MKFFPLVFLLFFLIFILTACSDPNTERVIRILNDSGYTNVELTGYRWRGCSEDDTYATGFNATSAVGRSVNGVVCSNLFGKGATIRLF